MDPHGGVPYATCGEANEGDVAATQSMLNGLVLVVLWCCLLVVLVVLVLLVLSRGAGNAANWLKTGPIAAGPSSDPGTFNPVQLDTDQASILAVRAWPAVLAWPATPAVLAWPAVRSCPAHAPRMPRSCPAVLAWPAVLACRTGPSVDASTATPLCMSAPRAPPSCSHPPTPSPRRRQQVASGPFSRARSRAPVASMRKRFCGTSEC